MSLILGISGGHSRSTAIALQGTRVVGSAVGPGLNDHASMESALATRNEVLIDKMWRLLANLVESVNRHGLYSQPISSSTQLCQLVENAVVSLPGVSTVYDVGRAEIVFAPLRFAKQQIIDDTWAVLVAGLRSAVGIAVIAGTGASTFLGLGQFQLGRQHKFDGFGALLGDWGSGFRMALRLLEEAGRSCDFRSHFPLESKLLEELNALHPMPGITLDSIQNWFDDLVRAQPADWRINLAKISRVVTQHDKSDSLAADLCGRLITESAASLAVTIHAAISSYSSDHLRSIEIPVSDLQIVCKGGQFEHSPEYYSAFLSQLEELGYSNQVIRSEFETSVGAALMASEDASNGFVRTTRTDAICDSVRSWPATPKETMIVHWVK